MISKKSKKTFVFAIKAIVSITLLTIIILNINWYEAGKMLKAANFLFLGAALCLNILERAGLTYKWNLLIWSRGVNISFIKLFLINAIGGFWGMFLPSSLGTDVVRGYYLSKNNSEKAISISSVFIDRILGMFSLLFMGMISIIIAGDQISKINIGVYILPIFLGILILFYFFQKDAAAELLKKYLAKIKYRRIGELGIKLHQSILEYKKYPKTLLFSFAITLLIQVTRVMIYYSVALAFNISIPIIYFFLFIPIIMLVIMIPISIGGLGLREGTFITFFGLVGMSINDAAIIAFSNSFINTLITLLGGVAFLFFKFPAEIPASPVNNEYVLDKKHETKNNQGNL